MRFPSLKPAATDNFRVDLVEEDFRNRVWEDGTICDWQQACDCPCGTVSQVAGRTASVRDFPLNCPLCNGRGKVWTSAQEIMVLVTASSSREEVYNVWGEYSSGTVFMTFLPENLPMEWDKITLKQGSRMWTESRIRQGAIDGARYQIVKRKILMGSESDPATPVEIELGVTMCFRGVGLGIANQAPLIEGTDFDVTDDGMIDWSKGDALGTAPLVGERYSIRYFARPVFVVRDFPFLKRDYYEEIRRELVYQNYPVKVLAILECLGTPMFTSPASPPDSGP